MSRLTKKDYKDWWHPVGAIINEQSSIYLNEVNHKLGKFEDLEDELGCPLDVVFKALKEGILVKDDEVFILGNKDEYTHFKVLSFDYHKFYNGFGFGYGTDDESNQPLWFMPAKHYKKTWWLKEDLSE